MFAAVGPQLGRHRTAFKNHAETHIAGRFGMWLLLIALGMLFAASLVAFLVIRLQLADAWPSGTITLPAGLWISTAVMLLSSGTMHLAVHTARRNQQRAVPAAVIATFLLGIVFLAIQVQCWLVALAELRSVWLELGESRLAATGFYVFSGIHGLHVIGGLIPMSVIALRALRRRYTAEHHGGLQYIAMYWHFLDAVWLVLFATLLIGM